MKPQGKYVDVTPTWTGMLPMLLELSRHENLDVRQPMLDELKRMAQAADRWNANAEPMLDALKVSDQYLLNRTPEKPLRENVRRQIRAAILRAGGK